MVRRRIRRAVAIATSATALLAAAPAGDATKEPVAAVAVEQAEHFAIFRRERTPADFLPDAAVDFVRRGMSPDNGAAPELARRALTTASGALVFLLPADGVMCLYVVHGEEGFGGCNRNADAAEGLLVGTSWTDTDPAVTRVVGAVPDGVDEVRLHTGDGTVERTTAADNAYAFETTRVPVRVEFGDVVVRVFSPRD